MGQCTYVEEVRHNFCIFFSVVIRVRRRNVHPKCRCFPDRLVIRKGRAFGRVRFRPFSNPFVATLLRRFARFFAQGRIVSTYRDSQYRFLGGAH